MKKTIFQKSIRLLVVVMVAATCLFVGVRQSYAADITMRPDSTGRIFIDTPMLVDTMDTMSIPAGTTVEFRNNGSIFVRGKLNIGMVGYRGNASQRAGDLTRGIRMIHSGSMSPITVRGGMLTALNVNFAGEKFINAFQGADVLISSSTFETVKDAAIMSIYQNSRLDISSSVIKSLYLSGQQATDEYFSSALIEIFANSNATMTAMRIESPRSSSGILIYNNSRLRVDDSRFVNCRTGITAFNLTRIKGYGNSFACETQPHLAYGGATIELLERHKECCSRVIFVPGIKGSRLFRRESSLWFGGIPMENQLWEPDSPSDVGKLYMSATGTSILSGVYSRDIIDKVNIFGTHDSRALGSLSPSIYGGFIAYLKKLKSDRFIDGYVLFPYDWRLGLENSLDNNLVKEIKKQASMSSDEKVILIAHSFGGFVVKNALSALESEGKEDLVRSVIYVAVPETGAPQAIFSAIHGDEQSILKGIIMDSMAAIRLAANMTSAHIVAPSAYFAGPIILEFLNKKTGIMTAYASSSDTSNRYSLASTHAWLIKAMRGADKQLGQESDSPAVRGFSSAPSASLSSLADIAKDDLYRQSAVLENAFRTYSIIGIGLPTPIGMRYQYAPCVPPKKKSFSDFGALSPCLNASALTRTTSYSKNGDGVVVFDGKDRRSGTDSIISLLESNMRDKTSIGHANIMESADIQAKITDMIKATSSPQTDPFYEGASGTGSNEINPWINTGKIFGLDISGFVEGRVQANVSRLTSQISASSTSIAALQIVTLDHAKKIQIIRGEPDVLAATTAINSSDRWSFGSAGTYDEVSLRSLADQSVTIAFSEHSEGPSFSGDSRIGIVETVTTESFSGVDVGFGSVMNIETQYVTADPSRTLTLDIDADDIGDMSIGPDSIESVGSGGSTGIQTALTYDGMKTLALSSIRDAKISISQLEIYALRQTNTAMLSWMERYLHAGNPTFALLTIKKRQVRLAEISAQYALRIKALEHGLLEGIRRGFRTPAERTKKDAEIIKIRAYLRDLARLKIILKAVEQRAIDLLI